VRKLLVVVLVALLLPLTGCGSGNTSSARVILGESPRFAKADLQAAADAVLADFRNLDGCSLAELTYDDASSVAQSTPEPTTDTVVFTAVFNVNADGGDGSLEPNSTQHWAWTVQRAGREARWQVVGRGAA